LESDHKLLKKGPQDRFVVLVVVSVIMLLCNPSWAQGQCTIFILG